MRGRLIIAASVLGLIVLGAFLMQVQKKQSKQVQDKEKEKAAQAGPAGADAFYATYRIRDPQKKLEALEKFVSDFTDSSQIGAARQEILKATLKIWPKDKKKIMDAASVMIKPPADAGAKIANIPEYQFIARELMSAGVLFDEAESFALKSLEFNKDDFAGSLRKKYAGWKRPAPSDEVIDREYLKEKVAYRTTLGRIYVKRGKIPEGERILREAYATSPTLSQAALGLADIAEQKGDNDTAVDYLATATLSAGDMQWRMYGAGLRPFIVRCTTARSTAWKGSSMPGTGRFFPIRSRWFPTSQALRGPAVSSWPNPLLVPADRRVLP
jgi:tetratricopeptide (TPR) repeat protein